MVTQGQEGHGGQVLPIVPEHSGIGLTLPSP